MFCNANRLALASLFSLCLPLHAQESRGTLLGRVTDPSDSVLVGAKVEAKNVDTGIRLNSVTNSAGDYIFPLLSPGSYTVTVENPGFKTYSRSGIVVRVNDQVAINVALEVGQASQTVQVSAETPLLDTSSASIGQVVSSRTIMELPLKDGMVLTLATLAPGVIFTPESAGYVRPFDTSSPSTMSIDGTRSGSNQFMMDGAPNMQGTQVAYSPPPGVVEEFKVQAANFDASSGFMGGASINMSLKSGTNSVHGQVYYFMQNPVFTADKYFRLAAGKPQFRLYRWGGSVSGPVEIPKLYNGRNRTFFMYGYEAIWSFDPSPWVVEAVPTAAMRSGDFSQLLAVDRMRYQIYDPYSIQPAANGRFSRAPVPNNIIPANLINPVARKIATLWDAPNQAGTIDGTNNYTKGKNAQDTYWNHIVRIDHNVSDKQRFYVRTNFTDLQRPENIRHNNAVGDNFFRYNKGFGIDHVYTLSPRMFLNTRYTLTRFITGYTPYQQGWDLAGLGFSSEFIKQINAVDPRYLKLPNIAVSGYASLGGVNTLQNTPTDIHEAAVNATTIAGAHTLRYGFAYRVYRRNNLNLGNSSGSLNFDTTWTRGPLDNSTSAPIGQGFAAFLYGLPSGSFPITDTYAEQSTVPAVFIQNDWKVSRKLTLSVGLRYERPSPVTERFNRSIRGFDASAASPIQAQAQVNYAKNPIAEIPVTQFKVLGGLNFAGVGGQPRTLWKTNQNLFMPRFGFAYSITPETVVRGGYGIFFDALGVTNVHVNQTGFSQSTDLVTSVDNGLTYSANLTSPFPGGFLPPTGASAGLATSLGQGITFFDENTTSSYMQRWQLAVQRQLLSNTLVEVSYVGNRGTRMQVARDINAVPAQYLSALPARDQANIDFLSLPVANPFYPLLPKTNLAGTTAPRYQLLRPYPQFSAGASNNNVIGVNQNVGYAWYHSMQVRLERRFSAGLTASMSYTWSKTMEALSFLNATDLRPEEVISSQDRPHRLAVTWLYELPFGKGKALAGPANAFVSKFISGWQLQGIYTAQSGAALGFGNAIFVGDLKNIPLSSDQRSVSRWFNIDAGFERNTARQFAANPILNIRTLSSRFAGIRADGPRNWDLSVIKNTRITERTQLQFRAEAINAMNHPQFTAPNTTPTSTAFGAVTGEFAWPRVIQFGLKLLF
jgi:hypothetical protein